MLLEPNETSGPCMGSAGAPARRAGKQITFRIAKRSDAKALARLHWLCSKDQPGGFMHKLGISFLTAYYEVLLNARSSIVVCADGGPAGLLGLVSACLEAGDELASIRAKRCRLFAAALPALLRRPKLIPALMARGNAARQDQAGSGFLVGSGARISFWGWSPADPPCGNSTKLLELMFRLLAALGVRTVRVEVDRVNRKVEIVHRFLGGNVVGRFTTPDGRDRLVIEHSLDGGKAGRNIQLRK